MMEKEAEELILSELARNTRAAYVGTRRGPSTSFEFELSASQVSKLAVNRAR